MSSETRVRVASPSLRTLISSQSPLRFSPSHEPYLSFPSDSPFSSYVFTPSRLSDGPALVLLLNDPSVDPWLFSMPRPYLLSHAEEYAASQMASQRKLLAEWEAGIVGWPCAVLRKRNEEGGDEFVGNFGVGREGRFLNVEDVEERRAKVEENVGRACGDPATVWTMGFALLPSHTGKGLLTAALHHLRNSYLVPVLNVAYIESHAFVGNAGSRAVHLKCGFKQTGSSWIQQREDRGGQLRETWNFEWRSDAVTVASPSLRTLISSQSPLRFSPSHEPYLPFPSESPFTDYFMTPFRLSDGPSFVNLVRDPSVDPWLFSPPKPYLLSDAEKRIAGQMKSAKKILETWEGGVEGWPLAILRRRKEDGSEEFVGDLGVGREDDFLEVGDAEERERKTGENERRERGDPEILWTMGFALFPSHTGKGLLTAAFLHLRDSYLIPVLNVAHIESYAFVGNTGSHKVHLKCGFKEIGTASIRMNEDRGGSLREEWIFEWRRAE